MVTPAAIFAQPDSVIQHFQSKHEKNIIETGNLYCFTDPAFQPGKVRLSSVVNFNEKYSELNPGLFPEISEQAESY